MRVVITGGSTPDEGLSLADHIQEQMFALKNKDVAFKTVLTTIASLDLSSMDSIEKFAGNWGEAAIDVLINCAGVNDIDWISEFTPDRWDRVMDVNVKGMFYLSRALMNNLRGGTILNIVSNASHVPMTNSACYNASKGAAHIMTQAMARELGKTHDITVFGISPNKLAKTNMSAYIEATVPAMRGWTAEQAAAYQLAALPAGEETDPAVLGEFIAFLLSSKERHKYLQGCVLPYGA